MSKLLTSIGLMSGTSLDGIDVALIRTDGESLVERGPSATYSYDASQQGMLRQAIADADTMRSRNERIGSLATVERQLTQWHADAVHLFCKENDLNHSQIDIIGFHGQTVLHRPEQHLTVQLGDGAALARATGLRVAHDLRADDVAAGGQGAPLVPVYHQALAAGMPHMPVAFLNIGGVANLTWIGRDGALVAFDTGPGNALLNDWCLSHGFGPLDRNGVLAASGKADESIVSAMLAHDYLKAAPPKSLDRNSFSTQAALSLSPANGARTLTAFTAACVAQGLDLLPERPHQLILCGGGRLNPVMREEISSRCRCTVQAAEALGFNGDSMEAEAWAYLAVRAWRKLPYSFLGTTGVPQPMGGGVIVEP